MSLTVLFAIRSTMLTRWQLPHWSTDAVKQWCEFWKWRNRQGSLSQVRQNGRKENYHHHHHHHHPSQVRHWQTCFSLVSYSFQRSAKLSSSICSIIQHSGINVPSSTAEMLQKTPVQRLKSGNPTTGLPSGRQVTHLRELNITFKPRRTELTLQKIGTVGQVFPYHN